MLLSLYSFFYLYQQYRPLLHRQLNEFGSVQFYVIQHPRGYTQHLPCMVFAFDDTGSLIPLPLSPTENLFERRQRVSTRQWQSATNLSCDERASNWQVEELQPQIVALIPN